MAQKILASFLLGNIRQHSRIFTYLSPNEREQHLFHLRNLYSNTHYGMHLFTPGPRTY